MSHRVVVETIETQAHRIIIKNDGIVRVYSKPSHIELQDVKALLDAYTVIRNGGDKLIVLLDPTEENSMSSEARKYIIKHMKDDIQCLVVIARKKFIRALFAIVSSVVNIGLDLKMFDEEDKAEEWILDNYLNG